MLTKTLTLSLTLLACVCVAESAMSCKDCALGCSTKDCISHTTMQTPCFEVTSLKDGLCQWYQYGLASHTDQELLGGKIVAYKIRWFSGAWSGWYVPGVNDMDCKYNVNVLATCGKEKPCKGSLRKMWSYFSDHEHSYIICKA